MPTPPKPAATLKSEKKSHRTKAELKKREQGEAAVLTGQKMKEAQEVKDDLLAHANYKRVKKLMEAIGKNDAIYEHSVNRYCVLLAEETRLKAQVQATESALAYLDQTRKEMDPLEYFDKRTKMVNQILSLDRQIDGKRRLLLNLEKENCMTVASALRAIPKEVTKEEDPLLRVLSGGLSG